MRTNHWQGAAAKDYLSLKIESRSVPDLPEPRPWFEIWVVLPAHGGRASSVRSDCPRWHQSFRPARRLPHRGSRPGEDPDREERRDRAGRLKGRLRGQAPARGSGRPGGAAGRGCRVLPHVDQRPARPHRQPESRTLTGSRPCRRATRCATTATTAISWSLPTRAPPRSPTSRTASPPTTASGLVTRSRLVGQRATTTRRWASPHAAPGSR